MSDIDLEVVHAHAAQKQGDGFKRCKQSLSTPGVRHANRSIPNVNFENKSTAEAFGDHAADHASSQKFAQWRFLKQGYRRKLFI